MPTLHVHLDESGDLRFSPRASRFYIFAVTWTYDPQPLAQHLTTLRLGLVKHGHNIPGFHATDDRPAHRLSVLAALRASAGWNYAAVVIEKAKVHPSLYDPTQFYPRFAAMPLKFVFRGRRLPATDRVLIYTDRLPPNTHHKPVEKAIKLQCGAELSGVPFHVFHHPATSNAWLQVTDYCAWAVFHKWEFADPGPYNELQGRLAAPELEIMAQGTTRYY